MNDIAYVGNFSLPYCTEVHAARTLEQLGHTVHRLQENGFTPAGLAAALERLNPGLFLFTRTWGKTVRMGHLDRLRARGIPSASYHLDLYLGLARDGGIDRDPFWRTDHVFTPDGDPASAVEFARRGINHHYLPPAVVADECYLADVPLEHDVVFVGSRRYHPEYPYRPALLDWLASTYGPRFRWYGAENGGVVRGEALNRLYASTRVVVGDSLILPGRSKYCSDRRYETPGRGGFMIQPWIAGIDDGFVDGVNTVFYQHGDFAQLEDLICHYLDPASDVARERIRRAGHEHVKVNHTYTHRLTAAFDTISGRAKCGAC
jgi:hypothetical protein